LQELWGQYSCGGYALPQLRRGRLDLLSQSSSRDRFPGYLSVDICQVSRVLSNSRLITAPLAKSSP
jgi:hypothetical protein